MSEFSLAGIDPEELVQRLTLYAYKLFGCFPDCNFEPVLKAHGESPEDLAVATFMKLIDPDDRSVQWKKEWGEPQMETLLAFLKKVLRNDFLDLKKRKAYKTSIHMDRDRDPENDGPTMTLEDFAGAWLSPEGEAIRSEQRDHLLAKFEDDPELRDVLAVQLNPEGYQAFTNQEMAELCGTTVSDIENRKKRIARRLERLLAGQ